MAISELFINNSTTVGAIAKGFSEDVGGNYFIAMFLVMLFLIIITLMFKLPIEASAILVLPFTILCYAFIPQFMAVTGVLLIYLAILVANNWIVK